MSRIVLEDEDGRVRSANFLDLDRHRYRPADSTGDSPYWHPDLLSGLEGDMAIYALKPGANSYAVEVMGAELCKEILQSLSRCTVDEPISASYTSNLVAALARVSPRLVRIASRDM